MRTRWTNGRVVSLALISSAMLWASPVGGVWNDDAMHDAHTSADSHAAADTHAKADPHAASAQDSHAAAPAASNAEIKPVMKPAASTPKAPARIGAKGARPANAASAPAPSTTEPAEAAKPSEPEMGENPTADEALKALKEGNLRWVAGRVTDPNISAERRTSVSENGQKPFVTVLTCADSRVPVERVFDRGVGDVFVIRVAGNVSGTSEMGTMEYAVEHLHTPVLLVMGHTKCGAVAAAVKKAEVHGNLATLVEQIEPAVDRARRMNANVEQPELIAVSIRENVWQTIFRTLKRSPDIREAVAKGELKVVGAVYDITTGSVDWMGEHPWQSEMLEGMGKDQAKDSPKDTAKEPSAANAEPAGH